LIVARTQQRQHAAAASDVMRFLLPAREYALSALVMLERNTETE